MEGLDTGTEAAVTSIESASNEQLDQIISGEVETEAADAGTETEAPENSESNKTEAEAPQRKAEKSEAPKKEAGSSPNEDGGEEVKLSRADWERLQKEQTENRQKLEQQERFIQRRNNELGEARKQLLEQRKALEERLSDEDIDDPRVLVDAKLAQAKIDQNLKQVEDEEQRNTLYLGTKAVMDRVASPEDGIGVDHMVKVLRRHKIDDANLQAFARDPVGWVGDPVRMGFLYDAAKAYTYVEKLYDHAKKQEKQIAELTTQVKDAPERVAGQINKALRTPVPLSATQPTRQASGKFAGDPSAWSNDELDAFLEKAKR